MNQRSTPDADLVATPSLPPLAQIYVAIVAAVLALFSLYGAYFGVFSDMIQLPTHIGLVLMLVYGTSLFVTGQQGGHVTVAKSRASHGITVVLLTLSIVVMGYHVVFHQERAKPADRLRRRGLLQGRTMAVRPSA